MKDLKKIRQAVADLISAEGCSCCRADERYDEAKERLAKLLKVPHFKDHSGYNFWLFRTIGKKP